MLAEFVNQFRDIYGMQYMSYNLHSLLHVADDVNHLGNLNKFSAFDFENHLGHLKKYARSGYQVL